MLLQARREWWVRIKRDRTTLRTWENSFAILALLYVGGVAAQQGLLEHDVYHSKTVEYCLLFLVKCGSLYGITLSYYILPLFQLHSSRCFSLATYIPMVNMVNEYSRSDWLHKSTNCGASLT